MASLSALPGALKLILPLGAGIALGGAIAWGASGGGGGTDSSAQAPSATSAPVVERTPGAAWDPARPDCPQGWRVYNDPDGYFSLCHPSELFVATGSGVPRGGQVVAITNYPSYDPQRPLPTPVPNTLRVTVYWRPTMPSQPQSGDACEIDRTVWRLPVKRTATVIAGKSATLCQASGESEDGGIEPFRMYIPDDQHGGWVELSSTRQGPQAVQYKGLVSQILATLRVP